MKWASVCADFSAGEDVPQAATQLVAALDGREPDLVLAFISSAAAMRLHGLAASLRREFENSTIVGGLGIGVIAAGQEFEDTPALSLTGAVLPDIEISAVHLQDSQIPPAYAERSMWETALGVSAAARPNFLLLADPFNSSTETLLKGLDRNYPQSPKLGGLISGVEQTSTPCLFLNDTVHETGVIALALSGNIQLEPIVAQGCRPIGDPMFATATYDNLILELDGRAPRDVLNDLYNKLPPADRQLFTESLFLGLAMDADRNEYGAGDFLIRTILGMDPESGALWLNAQAPPNTVVQLHLRDGVTSAQDLERVLARHCAARSNMPPAAALLFSCLGRGRRLYGHPNHDSNALRQHLGEIPIGGLFCNGEIGPVRGTTYLHGYTSVFGIVRGR